MTNKERDMIEKRICPYCGKEFESSHRTKKFCSADCCNKHYKELGRSKRAAEKVGSTIECEWCGKEFIATSVRSKYCSKECREKAMHQQAKEERLERKKKKSCTICGKPLGEYHSNLYCSKKCAYEATKRRLRENAEIKSIKPKEPKKPKLTISEVCRRAFAEHLSYGEYVKKYGV